MALEAIANRWRMDGSFQVGCVLVGVAADAESLGRGCLQFDPSDIFIDSDFVAARATSLDRRMYNLPLGFVFVALNALGGVGVFVQWYGVNGSKSHCGTHHHYRRYQYGPYCAGHTALHRAIEDKHGDCRFASSPRIFPQCIPKLLKLNE